MNSSRRCVAITILVPILLPVAQQLGIDPMHFGLVMVLNLMIGLLTPPVGLVLFVMARISQLSIERTIAAVISALVRTESQMLPCAGERRGSTDSHVRATAWQLPYQAGGRGVPQFGHVSVESVRWAVEAAFCPGTCVDGGAQHETAVASKG